MKSARSSRLGMTLVELLMVLVIVVILLAVIAPLMRVGTQDRRLREAARQVNAYFAGAQARAAERGRPVFVQMERKENASLKLNMAEVPPPYTGDTTDALVTSIAASGSNWTVSFNGGVSQLLARKLIKGGGAERIRFNFQGHLYPIESGSETSVVISNPLGTGVVAGEPPRMPSNAKGLSFQIYRAPIPTSTAPLTLPAGTAIDFVASGSGLSGTQFNQATSDTTPVEVGFSPNGGVASVLYTSSTPITGSAVHFLIGRIDKLGNENLLNPDAIWISVNPTTGIVTTTDNFSSTTVATARQYANSAQNLGGR